MPYPELLARTSLSFLEGASHPEEMVETAARLGVSHLGVVDRDGVYGLVRAHKAAKSAGVALIVGATLTVEARPPVSLLVEDARGWSALTRLLTAARAGSDKGRASVTWRRLVEDPQGLTCAVHYGWSEEEVAPLREAFGGHLEIVLTRSLAPGDGERTRSAVALAKAVGSPLMASNAPLFHQPDRRRLADLLTAIRRRVPLDGAGRWLQANAERHLLPEDQWLARFSDYPQAIREAERVAGRCTFSLDSLSYQYPEEVIPAGYTAMGWLKDRVECGLGERYPDGAPAEVRALVAHELRVIEALNFPHYFLTVDDVVRFARREGILCQGRGSAANSAVCYALGITSVDPSRMSVLFERFLSVERGEPPDIDVDFEHQRREEVIQYIYARYGRDRAALVNEVISYRWRSAVRDAGLAMGLSRDQVERLAKSTDRWAAGDGVSLEELVREAGLDPAEHRVRLTLELAAELKGYPRHTSIHVGGFVIAAGSLVDLVPVEPASMEARTVIQWDKDDIDALQFVKVDVLALGILTAIRRSFDLLRGAYGLEYDLATVPPEDASVYEMFSRADTVGVFQIESRAQMSMLPRLRPRCFYDLVIEVSLVRPGPIQGGMVHPYLRRRQGLEPVRYAHPDLEPILSRTLGVPIFQEQVMQMAVAVGGFSAGEADELRRAMGAWRKRGGLDRYGQRLVRGMTARGISKEYAAAIYEQILGFGEYGFPESHAASFALLVYVSGWLKGHFPEVWGAALLDSQPMGFYAPRAIVADAQRHGVEVRPVCVLSSGWKSALEEGATLTDEGRVACPGSVPGPRRALRLGLQQVRGLSEEHGLALVRGRAQGPYRSILDLATRSGLPRDALVALARADAFASLGVNRRQASWEVQGLWGALPLFLGLGGDPSPAALPQESEAERIEEDYRAVGLAVDRHPVQLLRAELEADGVIPLGALRQRPDGALVRIAGLVSHRQRPGGAKGVVFMTLEDETSLGNLVVWPKVWTEHRRVVRGAVMVGAVGRVQHQDGATSVLVERFWPLSAPARVPSRDFR
ncbi:MAG: error-prone DNA polymerase [Deltaproteobacteria bacterium]|nr:error-prone DNA polymerase [Deltaproteobacteria bacterium]